MRAASDDRRNAILRISFHCREHSSMTAEGRKEGGLEERRGRSVRDA